MKWKKNICVHCALLNATKAKWWNKEEEEEEQEVEKLCSQEKEIAIESYEQNEQFNNPSNDETRYAYGIYP